MQLKKTISERSSMFWVILIAAAVEFSIHLVSSPGYGFFFDELYTNALSRHLAFGYVDLPPLVPALVALSRAVLGESLLAMHIVPALAGAGTLVFACLIAKEFGGKAFAVALTALGFITVPLWLGLDSIFCYDCIDQLVLAGFLYVLVRFLRSGDRRLWLLLGLLAGVACLTKMTILFLGPGFFAALLLSKYRRDLLTPWPWIGAALCLVIVSPYLLWQVANHWPTLEYWNNYGALRVYDASVSQYLINIAAYMNPFLLPLFAAGLYRIFRPQNGVNDSFFGFLFLFTLGVMFYLHASTRMLAELFIPLTAAGAVLVEETLTGAPWKKIIRALAVVYLMAGGAFVIPWSLPILPIDTVINNSGSAKLLYQSIREFNGGVSNAPILLVGRLGWEELAQDVAGVYDQLPPQDRSIAGIYTDAYGTAGAIDQYSARYNLPHAVSGSLNYYLWGSGYSWDVMLIVTTRTNPISVFFKQCEKKAISRHEFDIPGGHYYIFVCKQPKVPAEVIWSSVKNFR